MVGGPAQPVGHVKKISGHGTSLRSWAHPQDSLVNETLMDRENGTARRVFSLCAIIDSYLAPSACRPASAGAGCSRAADCELFLSPPIRLTRPARRGGVLFRTPGACVLPLVNSRREEAM